MRWQFNESLFQFVKVDALAEMCRCSDATQVLRFRLIFIGCQLRRYDRMLTRGIVRLNGHRLEPKCWCPIYGTSIDSCHGINWLIYFHRAAHTQNCAQSIWSQRKQEWSQITSRASNTEWCGMCLLWKWEAIIFIWILLFYWNDIDSICVRRCNSRWSNKNFICFNRNKTKINLFNKLRRLNAEAHTHNRRWWWSWCAERVLKNRWNQCSRAQCSSSTIDVRLCQSTPTSHKTIN